MLTTVVKKEVYCNAEHFTARTAAEIKSGLLPYYDEIRQMPIPKTDGLVDLIKKNKETMASTQTSEDDDVRKFPRLRNLPDTMVINEGWIADIRRNDFNHFSQDLVDRAANPGALKKMSNSFDRMFESGRGKVTGEAQPASAADLMDSLERVLLHEVT